MPRASPNIASMAGRDAHGEEEAIHDYQFLIVLVVFTHDSYPSIGIFLCHGFPPKGKLNSLVRTANCGNKVDITAFNLTFNFSQIHVVTSALHMPITAKEQHVVLVCPVQLRVIF